MVFFYTNLSCYKTAKFLKMFLDSTKKIKTKYPLCFFFVSFDFTDLFSSIPINKAYSILSNIFSD